MSKKSYTFAFMSTTMRFIYMQVMPSEQIGVHEHPLWELSYIISGRGQRVMGSKEEPFRKGEVVLVPPDLPHGWLFSQHDKKIENISIFFADNTIRQLAVLAPEFESVLGWMATRHEAQCFMGKTLNSLQTILMRMRYENDARRIVSLLELLNVMTESQEHYPVGRLLDKNAQRLEQIQLYINCNYNHDICIESIARHICMNRSSLCTFFRRHTGRTIVEAINARRLEVARNLMRSRKLTIQQICFESGFKDVSYFYRLFKRVGGMTPKEYQTRHFCQ